MHKRQRREEEEDIPEWDARRVTMATDKLEILVAQVANRIIANMKAPYDTAVYAEVFFAELQAVLTQEQVGADDLLKRSRVERHFLVPIAWRGRVVGSCKVPFVVVASCGRPLLLLEIKSKRTMLKAADLESLSCAAEQIRLADEECSPRAVVLNFAAGDFSSIVMHADGTVTEG